MASGCPPGRLIPLQVQPRPKPLQSWRVPQVTAQMLMPMKTQAVPAGHPASFTQPCCVHMPTTPLLKLESVVQMPVLSQSRLALH